MPDRLFNAMINPLAFTEVDSPWAVVNPTGVTPEIILNYICPTMNHNLENIIEKYREISVENPRLNVVPAEDHILEKLIWPLRHAKASYMVGNYLGTISLCGMVAEMVAILYFDISNIMIGNEELSTEKQKMMFGSTFEKLGQEKRVNVLRVFDIISEETKVKFDKIRFIRRKYLHLWSQDHDRLPADTIEIFTASVSIVAEIIGQDIAENGSFKLNPKIVNYLERTGIFKPED